MKKNKGITLIALVVTIIVLLILAGISIATLTGQNGILTRSNEAKEENVRAKEKDEIGLAYNAAKITNEENNKPVVDAGDLQTALRGDGVEKANTSQEGERIKIIYTDTKNIYYIDEDGNILDGGNFEPASREGLKVGDYINYTPDTAEEYAKEKLTLDMTGISDYRSGIKQERLNWQILQIYEDGRMDLIGSPTMKNLTLANASGYNNGVYLINDVCETLYSKPSKGIVARSINMEDIEKWLTKEGKEQRDNYTSIGGMKYGETKTKNKDFYYYPNLYPYEKGSGINSATAKPDGMGISDIKTPEFIIPTTEKSTDLDNIQVTVTQTYWETDINTINFGEGNSVLYNEDNYYWVASRYVNSNNYYEEFGIRFVNCSNYEEGEEEERAMRTATGSIGGRYMMHSSSVFTQPSGGLRPVVTIGADIKITKSEGTNNKDNTHLINW